MIEHLAGARAVVQQDVIRAKHLNPSDILRGAYLRRLDYRSAGEFAQSLDKIRVLVPMELNHIYYTTICVLGASGFRRIHENPYGFYSRIEPGAQPPRRFSVDVPVAFGEAENEPDVVRLGFVGVVDIAVAEHSAELYFHIA